MKRSLLLTVILLAVALSTAHASKNMTFKVGLYAPAELKTGVIWGLEYGYAIDENVSLLFGGDLYWKTIEDKEDLGDTESVGVNLETGRYLSKWKGFHMPLTAKIRMAIPLDNYSSLKPFVTAGLGIGYTHISFTDLANDGTDPQEDSLTYTGLVWQAGGGILYRIGSRSSLIGEMIYNGAKFEKDEEGGYYTTLNSSGLMFRVGFNILMF
ncbi:MAG TPA: outer membrane beta-barrel protein [Candidatus Mcinerneyibacteriales bacterium]|nr:outer membrane beta-barrel protein [Candidatus Mcinerneyibacteriales bacterium]